MGIGYLAWSTPVNGLEMCQFCARELRADGYIASTETHPPRVILYKDGETKVFKVHCTWITRFNIAVAKGEAQVLLDNLTATGRLYV